MSERLKGLLQIVDEFQDPLRTRFKAYKMTDYVLNILKPA